MAAWRIALRAKLGARNGSVPVLDLQRSLSGGVSYLEESSTDQGENDDRAKQDRENVSFLWPAATKARASPVAALVGPVVAIRLEPNLRGDQAGL